MNAFVTVQSVGGGVITADDQAFFKNIKMFYTEDGRLVITFDYENSIYFEKWVERVGASPIGDEKDVLRLTIEQSVGDSKDRLSDCFKLTQMLFIMMLEFYKLLNDTSTMDIRVKEVFEVFKTAYDSGTPIFNIQLKDSYAAEIQKLIKREADVVGYIQTSSDNII